VTSRICDPLEAVLCTIRCDTSGRVDRGVTGSVFDDDSPTWSPPQAQDGFVRVMCETTESPHFAVSFLTWGQGVFAGFQIPWSVPGQTLTSSDPFPMDAHEIGLPLLE